MLVGFYNDFLNPKEPNRLSYKVLVDLCLAHYKFLQLCFWFFRHFGCVISFTLNFRFVCLSLLSKNIKQTIT